MSERETIKATITKNAKKLWACKNFRTFTAAIHKGKLPTSSGEEIVLYLPGETPSPFCNAKRAWEVAIPPKSLLARGRAFKGYKVCEHQIDLPKSKAMTHRTTKRAGSR
jgi:hypothetical protein